MVRNKMYRRLPGRRWSSMGAAHSLWLGPDHLLWLSDSRFTENYRRFYYADIQAVILRRTPRWMIWTLILGGLGGIFSLLAAAASGGGRLTLIIFSIPVWLLLLVNWLRGPTCVTHLVTAVNTVELVPLGRLPAARKSLSMLSSAIELTQGTLAPEDLTSLLAQPVRETPLPAGPLPASPAASSGASRPRVHEHGLTHQLLFYFLLFEALHGAVSLKARGLAVTLASIPIIVGMTAMLVAALIKQQGSDIGPRLRKVMWWIIGYWLVNVTNGYVLNFMTIIKDPNLARDRWAYLKYVAALSPWDSPFLLFASLFSIIVPMVLGLWGLSALRRFREEHRAASAAPRSPAA